MNTDVRDDLTFLYTAQVLAAQRTLGYAQITASQGSVASLTDITGLTTTVTVTAGRRVRITAYCASFGSFSTTDAYSAYINEGVTQLQQTNVVCTAVTVGSVFAQVVLTPSAASHTYKVQAAHTAGAAAGTWAASGTFPSFILVEDIGL